jgi:uncharacterized protein with ParB-like and HNH nuclease domain
MKLDANQMSLSTLVSSARSGFSIPDFQRNYSWGQAQLEQFWIDITAVAEKKFPDHFLGPIVLIKTESRKPVIDGQQRLTTLVILSSVIRDMFVINYEDPQYTVDGTSQVYSNLLNPNIFLSDLTTPLLQGNYQIKSVLESYVLRNPNSELRKRFDDRRARLLPAEKRSCKNLIAAHSYFQLKLKEWVEEFSPIKESQLERLRDLVASINERIQFLTIQVENEEDAFTIFETLNERGLKLSPADLIKSYILRKIIEENNNADRDEITQIWDQIMESLGDYDVTNFLRHYLLTLHKEPIQKKIIFKKIKDEVEPRDTNLTPVSPRKKLEDIKFASINYSQLLVNANSSVSNSHIESGLRKLNMISDNHRIFLLKILQSGFEDNEMLIAIRTLEILMFRWIVCGENAQVLENLLQTACHKIKKSDIESVKVACEFLLDNAPSDDAFSLALSTKLTRDSKLQAYALRSVCLGLTGTDVTTNRNRVSVEHIAPQNPENSEWFNKIAKKELSEDDPENSKTYEDYVYQWGNLTILEQKLNSSIQNSLWSIKKNGSGRYKGYNGSSIATTVELLDIDDWTSDVIEKRTQWFVECALKFWCKSPFALQPSRLNGFKY